LIGTVSTGSYKYYTSFYSQLGSISALLVGPVGSDVDIAFQRLDGSTWVNIWTNTIDSSQKSIPKTALPSTAIGKTTRWVVYTARGQGPMSLYINYYK